MSSVPPASQSWPLPESVPTTLIVYCCLDPHNVPSTDELSDVALRWMADNIPMPHHDIIAMWFRMPVSGIAAMSKAQLPQDILHRHLVMTDALTQEMIQYATHAIMIKSEGPCVSSSTGLWPCVAAGFACMYRYGGVMVDLDMSAKIQPRKILDMMTEYLLPRAAMFVRTVHVEDQGRLKIIVHGMLHFGLPALVVDNVPRGLGDSCERGLMGVAQIVGRTALLLKARSEQPSSTLEFPIDATVSEQDVQVAYGFAADGAARSIDVRLELEPDGNPAFIKVLPPRQRANDFVGWINEFASAFASPLPSTASHLYHDEAMEEAHRRAVAELPYARQRFLSGEIAPGMTLVKYAFRVNEHQSEYMWLAVREWGKMITGELINQPVQRADLKMGQIVTIDSADVYDWVVAGPGGPEGGYTDRVRAQASPASPPVNEPLPPADLIPDYVKLRGDPEFARRVNEAGREYIAAEQLPRWRLGRSHTSQQLTNAGILFAVAAIFAVVTIYWLAVILASIGAFMLARNVKLHGRIGGILTGVEDVQQRGEFRVAMPIMTNMSLRQPGTVGAAGLVLIMPTNGDLVQIYDAVMKGMSRRDPEDKAVIRMLNDERYLPNHRFAIPSRWTGGVEVVGTCLMIERSSMASGVIDSPFFPVLYGPGPKGGVATLPLKIVWDCQLGPRAEPHG